MKNNNAIRYILAALLLVLTVVSNEVQAQPTRSAMPSRSNSSSAQRKPASKQSNSNKPVRLDDIHHVAFWGGVGYSGLVNSYGMGDYGQHKFVGGGGGMIGVGYEYHYKKFQLSVGPEFRIFSSQDNLLYNRPYQLNLPEYGQTYNYIFGRSAGAYEPLKQTEVIGQITLPILFGATFPVEKIGHIFFMAGAKIGYTLLSSYSQKGVLTTSITDNWAYDDNWYDIGHNTETTRGTLFSGKDKFGLDAALSAEVGVMLDDYLSADWQDNNEDSKHPWHMRVSLFLDYGLNNMNVSENVDFASIDATRLDEPMHGLGATSLHKSGWANGRVNSLLVGAKFTALLQLNKPKKPKPQNPYLVMRLMNARTGMPIAATEPKATVEITALQNGRLTKRTPNSKSMVLHRAVPGNYHVTISQPGYLPYEPFDANLMADVNTNLQERIDTTYIMLYPEPTVTLHITDVKTGKPITASITILDTATNKTQLTLRHEAAHAKVTGKVPFNNYYTALVHAENYQQQFFPIGHQGYDDIELTLALTPVEKRTYILENMFFATDKTDILPKSEPALQELFEFLSENKGVRILITGHTDWIGSDEDNQKLSEGRSASVRQAMIDRGIDPARIETDGKGETMPIATNDTEKGRQRNRRVEITILETGTEDEVNVEHREVSDEEL